MSVKLDSYCSILSFVESHNPDLHKLIQHLCLSHIFTPRSRFGITFLMPDKALTAKLLKLAEQDSDAAAKNIQNGLLLEYVSSLNGFKGRDAKNPLPNARRQGVALGANLKMEQLSDAKFKGRSPVPNRDVNIAVYHLSDNFVADGEPVDLKELAAKKDAQKSAKTGGADLGDQDQNNRQALFEAVLKAQCGCDEEKNNASVRDAAMEILYELHQFYDQKDSSVAQLIRSQLSYDTLASLAVVLQPYKNEPSYISDITPFIKQMYSRDGNYRQSSLFTYNSDVANQFCALHQSAMDEFKNHTVKGGDDFIMNKTNANKCIEKYIENNSQNLPSTRQDKEQMKAELELRLVAALAQENEANYDELLVLFKKYNLDKPYLLDLDNIDSAFFYSVLQLAVRSDALYIPHDDRDCGVLSDISQIEKHISLSKTMKEKNTDKRQKSVTLTKQELDRLEQVRSNVERSMTQSVLAQEAQKRETEAAEAQLGYGPRRSPYQSDYQQ